jgi:hypothetical protein
LDAVTALLSRTVTEIVNVPAEAGVPDRFPAESNVSPGIAPDAMVHV